MHEFNDYKLLREKTDLATPDPDDALDQSLPAALGELGRPRTARGSEPVRLKVEIVLEWLQGTTVLTGNRGSFDMQVIRVTTRRGETGNIVVDSAVLRGQIAHRPVILDDILVGDRFTVRLLNLQPHPTATKARVLYREII